MNKTQKAGLAVIVAGILFPLVIVGLQTGGEKLATGAVGGGPEILAWVLKIFGGGGAISISGVLTFLWGLWQSSRGQPVTPLPINLPSIVPAPADTGIVVNGATPAELQEMALATMAFVANRKSKSAQYRFVAAVAAVSDAIPGFRSEMVDGELVSRLRLFDAAPVQAGKAAV